MQILLCFLLHNPWQLNLHRQLMQFNVLIFPYSFEIIVNSFFCSALKRSTDLSRLRPLRDALVEEAEFLDIGVGISPFSDGLKPSLIDMGRGPGPGPGGMGSWITITSSLPCWPRCSLAKSKPFTLGACNWGAEEMQRGEEIRNGKKGGKPSGRSYLMTVTYSII